MSDSLRERIKAALGDVAQTFGQTGALLARRPSDDMLFAQADAVLAAIEASPITDKQIEAVAEAMWRDDHEGSWPQDADVDTAEIYRGNACTAIDTYRAMLALARAMPPPPTRSRTMADKQLRELMRRVDKARNFPTNTCPASRHLHMIANNLARGKPYPMLDEEPEHCAETMLAVLESLWTLRTKTGWPDNTSEQAARDDAARADPEPGR